MRRILTALVLMISFVTGRTDPHVKADELSLKFTLEKDWSELIVSQMIDQGCVAPIYFGLRISRTAEGLSISPWQEDQRGPLLGVLKQFDSSLLPQFIESTVRHYASARASKDFHEQIAELKSDEERKQALAAAIKNAGDLPVGGFGACGIDVRIKRNDQQFRFRDNYGTDGFEGLQKWLAENGATFQ
jgi:hypothetical protein